MRKAACGSRVPPSTPKSVRIARISSLRAITAPPMTSPGAGGVLGEAVHEDIDVEVTVLVEPGEGVVEDGQRAGGARAGA